MLRWFESTSSHQKAVTKMLSQLFFFVVSPKIRVPVSRFSKRVLQCCPTVFGRLGFFVCGFWPLALFSTVWFLTFFKKIFDFFCCFQNVFNFPAANFSLAAGIFCFSRQFSVCFQVFHFLPLYNKETRLSNEYYHWHRPRLLRHTLWSGKLNRLCTYKMSTV